MQQERDDKSRSDEDRWSWYMRDNRRGNKFDKEFGIGLISECEKDGNNSEDEEESSGEYSD